MHGGEQWWSVAPEGSLGCVLVALDTSTGWGTSGDTAALQESIGVTVDLQLNMNW